MRIEDICRFFENRGFPKASVQEHPDRASVQHVRSLISSAIIDPNFLSECVALELDLLESSVNRRGLMPFLTVPGFGIRFAFGYWSPGSTPGPHEHTAWTITAVAQNEIQVRTFDRDESYRQRQLVEKNCFTASAGRVGYIYEPCIHQPKNISANWSLSLHVTSPRDGENLDAEGGLPDQCLVMDVDVRGDHPYHSVTRARHKQGQLRELASLVALNQSESQYHLLTRCSVLAMGSTRARLANLLGKRLSHTTSQPAKTLMLSRVHDGLELSLRTIADTVALVAESEDGPREEVIVSDVARNAIAHVVKHKSFQVAELQGKLSPEECFLLSEILEDSGLFVVT